MPIGRSVGRSVSRSLRQSASRPYGTSYENSHLWWLTIIFHNLLGTSKSCGLAALFLKCITILQQGAQEKFRRRRRESYCQPSESETPERYAFAIRSFHSGSRSSMPGNEIDGLVQSCETRATHARELRSMRTFERIHRFLN